MDLLSTTGLDFDIAYSWIKVLFPKEDGTPYASALSVFSSTLTFFGGLFLAWHVIQGIVLSAYTGKVLGERFHQIWAPLRVVLGFGMLVPIAGGFSSIHILLRDVVGVAAVKMGNAPIEAYIKSVVTAADGADKSKKNNIAVTAIKGRYIYDEFLDREICNAIQDKLTGRVWKAFGLTGNLKLAPINGEEANTIFGVTYSAGSYVWDYGGCGTITFVYPTVDQTGILEGSDSMLSAFASERRAATGAMVESIRGTINREGLGNYFATHDVVDMESQEILTQLRTEEIVPAGLAEKKEAAFTKWDNNVSTSAAKVYKFVMDKNGSLLTKRIEEYGFMAAGSFERALSKASSLTVALANASPKTTAPDLSEEFINAYMAAKAAVLGGPKLKGEGDGNGSMKGLNKTDEPLDSVLSSIAPAIASMKSGHKSTTGDPIGDMIAFGHSLLTAWEAAGLAILALRETAVGLNAAADGQLFTAQNLASFGLTGGGAKAVAAIMLDTVTMVQSWIAPILMAMLIVGILHAFVLPMMPMLMVFVMGVSWLILFLEASIASLLWAFAFIRMDGNDFFDKNQAPGATLVFNLFLRPAIGMLAFVGGLLLLPVLMDSLSILWNDSFSNQTYGGGVPIPFTGFGLTDMIQWIVGIVMYTWMQWHLTLRLFGLIPTIADRVGHWMGFGASHGYNDGQETSAAIGAAVAAGQVGRTLQRRPWQTRPQKERQKDDKKESSEGSK
jgi:conjugal transfer/type IV secretion protein DotA/TraY